MATAYSREQRSLAARWCSKSSIPCTGIFARTVERFLNEGRIIAFAQSPRTSSPFTTSVRPAIRSSSRWNYVEGGDLKTAY